MRNIDVLIDICRIVAIVVAIPALRQFEHGFADILVGRSFDIAIAQGSLFYFILPSLLLWFVAPRFIRRFVVKEIAVTGWPLVGSGYLLVGLAFFSFVASDVVGMLANTYFVLIGAYIDYGLVLATRFTVIFINVGIGIWLITMFQKKSKEF